MKSSRQTGIFRILLGTYTALFFLLTFPRSAELFSSEGMLESARTHVTYGYFPNILYINDSPHAAHALTLLGGISALLVLLGFLRRPAALVSWYCYAAIWNRNELFWSPAMPYVGWLLLLLVLLPSGESFSLYPRSKQSWEFPRPYLIAAWFTLGLGYSVSGFFKLLSPSWVDGSAIRLTLEWTWAREWLYPELLLQAPAILLQSICWGTLFLELLFLPACLFKFSRKLFWLGMTLVQFNLLLLLDLADLTLGVLLLHFLTFNPNWIKSPDDPNEQSRHTT